MEHHYKRSKRTFDSQTAAKRRSPTRCVMTYDNPYSISGYKKEADLRQSPSFHSRQISQDIRLKTPQHFHQREDHIPSDVLEAYEILNQPCNIADPEPLPFYPAYPASLDEARFSFTESCGGRSSISSSNDELWSDPHGVSSLSPSLDDVLLEKGRFHRDFNHCQTGSSCSLSTLQSLSFSREHKAKSFDCYVSDSESEPDSEEIDALCAKCAKWKVEHPHLKKIVQKHLDTLDVQSSLADRQFGLDFLFDSTNV